MAFKLARFAPQQFRSNSASRSLASRVACALAMSLLASTAALAQGISSNAEGPREGEEFKGNSRVVDINEVERGIHVGIDFGMNYYLGLSGAGYVPLNQEWTSPGKRVGIRVGYDILNNLSIDGFLLANFNDGVINEDLPAKGEVTGDLAHFAPGLGVKFAFVSTERFFAFVRAGGGYAFWFPQAVAGSMGSVQLDGSIGVEYYTQLRHLSIGAEADFQALLAPNAFGFMIYPTFKYTF